MLPQQLKKALRLKRREVTWFASRRRAYAWIAPRKESAPSRLKEPALSLPKGRPYRPYAITTVEAERGTIRRVDVKGDSTTPEDVLASLLDAMRRPILGSGGRYRPARVVLDDRTLVETLAPALAQVEVRCDYQATLPFVDDALRVMARRRYKRALIPGLLSVPRVTVPLIGELFAAAADFYRQAPWERLDNKSPVKVRYPRAGQARYALVLGSGRETFGLSLYESLDDVYLVYSGIGPEEVVERVSDFSLIFEEAMAMSFYDLDAIEKYQWPVAAESAYPIVLKLIPGGDATLLPDATELAWLAAALRTVPDFIVKHVYAGRPFPRPAKTAYSLPGVHGGQQVALRYDGDLWELGEAARAEVANDVAQVELEAFIHDWYWDPASHEFAHQMGQFLFEFLDDVDAEGLSERTIHKHTNNCWLIGKFTCDYGYRETFSPGIFRGEPGYLGEFKRKVSDSPAALRSYQATWRKLARYVRRLENG